MADLSPGAIRARDPLGWPHRLTQAASPSRLFAALAIGTIVLLAEIVGGLLSGSLALLGDAIHVALDLGAILIGRGADRLARRAPDAAHTYGLHRFEAVGAPINGVLLLVASAVLVTEGIQRLGSPTEVNAPVMLAVAAGALVANSLSVWLVGHGEHGSSLKTRAVLWHLAGDAAGAAAVLVAAGIVAFTGWLMAGPLATLTIAGLLALGGVRLLREVLHVLVEGALSGLSTDLVAETLTGIPGVAALHDLHVWSLGDALSLVSAHVEVTPAAQAGLAGLGA